MNLQQIETERTKSRQDLGESGADEPRRTNGTVPSGTDRRCRKESNGTGEYQIERAIPEIKRETGTSGWKIHRAR